MHTTAGKGAMLLGLLCNLVCSAMVADAAPVASVAAAVGASQLTAGTEPVAQLPRALTNAPTHVRHDDMIVLADDIASSRHRRDLVKAKIAWVDAVIPYSTAQLEGDLRKAGLASAFPGYMAKIQRGFDEFEAKTPVRFRPAKPGDDFIVEFTGGWTFGPPSWAWQHVGFGDRNGLSCSAAVGISRDPANWMNPFPMTPDYVKSVAAVDLNKAHCFVQGIVLHELAHVVGMFHEQDRPDRNEYLAGLPDVSAQIKGEHGVNSLGVEYDFKSIVQYPIGSIRGCTGLTTKGEARRAEQGIALGDIGRLTDTSHLSELDVVQFNMLYFSGDIAGPFHNTHYTGVRRNDWHVGSVTAATTTGAATVFRWENKAGKSWLLTKDQHDHTLFHLGPDCPYYSGGRRSIVAVLGAGGKLTGLQFDAGSSSEYYAVTEAHNPVNCPHSAMHADTCWGNSAYQMCPIDRQGAYMKVMAKRGDQSAMHTVFQTLTTAGFGCTKSAPADKFAQCPYWKQAHCTQGPWRFWMAANCATTCNTV